jgi:hypothetical protein
VCSVYTYLNLKNFVSFHVFVLFLGPKFFFSFHFVLLLNFFRFSVSVRFVSFFKPLLVFLITATFDGELC